MKFAQCEATIFPFSFIIWSNSDNSLFSLTLRLSLALLSTGRTVIWGNIEMTWMKYPLITTIPYHFQGDAFFFIFYRNIFYRLSMEKEILNKLIYFLIRYIMKRYSSITTFQEIHNIFLFNLFLFYQLFESCQGFIFNIYFNWKTPSESRFLLLKPREISEYKTRAWMSKWNLHLIEIWPQTITTSHDSHVSSVLRMNPHPTL